MLWWKHLGSSLTLGNKMFSRKDFRWITYVIISRNVCLYKKEGSVRKIRCDPAGNVQVYRVIATPRVYTAKHVENGHFRVSWEFKVAFWVSLSSLFFLWNFYVDLARTSGDKWKKTTASRQSEESTGNMVNTYHHIQVWGRTGDPAVRSSTAVVIL